MGHTVETFYDRSRRRYVSECTCGHTISVPDSELVNYLGRSNRRAEELQDEIWNHLAGHILDPLGTLVKNEIMRLAEAC